VFRSSRRDRLARDIGYNVVGVVGQGSSLDLAGAACTLPEAIFFTSDTLPQRLLGFRSGVVVCHLQSQLASVLALAIEALPEIVLPSARHHHLCEIDPGFADQISPFILAKDRYLQVVVVG